MQKRLVRAAVSTVVLALMAGVLPALLAPTAAQARPVDAKRQAVLDYWTPARLKSAKPLNFEFAKGAAVGKKVAGPVQGKAPTASASTITPTAYSTASTGSSWLDGGLALSATGKVFFNIGSLTYVCSGSVVQDADPTRSLVLTAGHCSYDNASQAFVTNWIFIPDYDSNPTTTCANTTYGCWTATALVTHSGFTSQTGFTTQATQYDWSFAVVGAGGKSGTAQLDATVGAFPLAVSGFTGAGVQSFAFGYPQAAPYTGVDLTYCSEALGQDSLNGNLTWAMPSCTMTGGASGGPWMSNFSVDRGGLSSVNSYKYTGSANGMYGPKFNSTTTDTYNAALTATGNTAVGAAAPPVAAVTITGGSSAAVGVALSADTSGTTGPGTITYSFQWQRASTATGTYSNISGATSRNYTPTSSDYLRFLKVRATATNSGGSSTATSAATSAVTATPPTAVVTITGTRAVGFALTASTTGTTGTAPISYTYQWSRGTSATGSFTNISGATKSTYTLATADRGYFIRVTVKATNVAGSSTAVATTTSAIA